MSSRSSDRSPNPEIAAKERKERKEKTDRR
jgi:hypothetical protein